MQHLETEYSTENLDFWVEAGHFAERDPEDLDAFYAEANRIYRQYIAECAPRQVNIPASMRKEIDQMRQVGQASPTLYAEAREEVLNMMNRDSFNRFKNGPLFERLLQEVGTYEDKPQPQPPAGENPNSPAKIAREVSPRSTTSTVGLSTRGESSISEE